MQTNTRTLRAATHAMILGLALSTAGIGASTALADPAAVTTIDGSHDVSFTIHKKLNPAETKTPTGQEDSTVVGTPLNGVTFTLQKLNFDLTDNEQFKDASKLTVEEAQDSANQTGAEIEGTTANDGTVRWTKSDGLTVGAYLVTETDAGDKGIQKSAPFIVFLPMTDSSNQAWNYDVVAYPKNTKVDVTKTLKDGGDVANAGDVITYVVAGGKPTYATKGGYISWYRIFDVIPEELSYDGAVNPAIVTIGKDEDTAEELAPNVDYELTAPDGSSRELSVVLTKAGLRKLMNAGADVKVRVAIPVTVNKVGGEDGIAKNVGHVEFKTGIEEDPENPKNPDNPDTPGDPVRPEDPTGGETPPVKNRWVDLQIVKKSDDATPKMIEGAKFELYRCNSATELTSDALTVSGATNWTTGSEGTVKIESIQVPKRESDNPAYKYCLKEIEAPADYELLPEPIVIDVNPDESTKVVTQDVINVKKTVNKLPSTGGAGVGLLMALGAGILGAGAFAAKRASRQKS